MDANATAPARKLQRITPARVLGVLRRNGLAMGRASGSWVDQRKGLTARKETPFTVWVNCSNLDDLVAAAKHMHGQGWIIESPRRREFPGPLEIERISRESLLNGCFKCSLPA